MSKSKLAILIVGFDGYNCLWTPFFELFKKNWPDCPYKIYLVTNILEPEYENVKVITTSEKFQWSLKVREALLNIDEEYIYMLLEDFFICYPVHTDDVEKLFSYIINNDILYVKTPYKGVKERKKRHFRGQNQYYEIMENEKYGISLLPGIWKKSFLLDLIGDKDYNPWKFEWDRIKESRQKEYKAFNNCFTYSENLLNIYNGVIQGKYVRDTYRRIEKQGIKLDQSKIPIMDLKTYILLSLKRIGIVITPKKLEPIVKKIASKFGFVFVSDINA